MPPGAPNISSKSNFWFILHKILLHRYTPSLQWFPQWLRHWPPEGQRKEKSVKLIKLYLLCDHGTLLPAKKVLDLLYTPIWILSIVFRCYLVFCHLNVAFLDFFNQILTTFGTPGWLSSWASTFSSGHDPGVQHWVLHGAPRREPASPTALSLPLSVSHE